MQWYAGDCLSTTVVFTRLLLRLGENQFFLLETCVHQVLIVIQHRQKLVVVVVVVEVVLVVVDSPLF